MKIQCACYESVQLDVKGWPCESLHKFSCSMHINFNWRWQHLVFSSVVEFKDKEMARKAIESMHRYQLKDRFMVVREVCMPFSLFSSWIIHTQHWFFVLNWIGVYLQWWLTVHDWYHLVCSSYLLEQDKNICCVYLFCQFHNVPICSQIEASGTGSGLWASTALEMFTCPTVLAKLSNFKDILRTSRNIPF